MGQKISPSVLFELKWPTLAVCMARASITSGVPFAELAQAAADARKALAECGFSTWIGGGDVNEFDDQRNWLYGRVPRRGDTVIFDHRSPGMVPGMDWSQIALNSVTITRGWAAKRGQIGEQGRTL